MNRRIQELYELALEGKLDLGPEVYPDRTQEKESEEEKKNREEEDKE